MPERTCTIDGCGVKHYGRGLCRQHYNAQHNASRGKASAICEDCGVTYLRSRCARTSRCLPCAEVARIAHVTAYRRAHADERRTSWPRSEVRIVECVGCGRLFVAQGPRTRPFCTLSCQAASRRRSGAVATRACKRCDATVSYTVATRPPDYCDACRTIVRADQSRATRQLRRARQRGADSERVVARRIYERDHWSCGICGMRVNRRLRYPHPRSVSLDHIVPLARGGGHRPDNVQCSHLDCNMHKHTDTFGQLLLIAD